LHNLSRFIAGVLLSASAQSTLLLFFSVTLFAIHPAITVLFFQNHCFNPHIRAKKESGTPTATTVPEMRQKKTTQSYVYIMLSYVCFL